MQTKKSKREEESEKKKKGGKEKRERERPSEQRKIGEGGAKKGKRKGLVQTEDRRLECICRQRLSQYFQNPLATLFET